MSKKTRKKSSKSPAKASARAKPRKSPTAKRTAKKIPATRKKAAPKAAKVAKAKVSKAKAPAKTGRTATTRARATAVPGTKATAKTSVKSKANPAVRQPAPAAEASAENVAKTIRASGPLTEGATVPALKLPRDGGETVSLAPKAGRKLVIFFYPRADTPGCTKEAMDFSRLSADFDAARADVVGISADPLKAQEAFRNKHELKIPLLSDEPHDVLEMFGVWGEKSMYGRVFQGVLRTTVVIGSNRKVLKIWHSVKVDGHANEVLEYVNSR